MHAGQRFCSLRYVTSLITPAHRRARPARALSSAWPSGDRMQAIRSGDAKPTRSAAAQWQCPPESVSGLSSTHVSGEDTFLIRRPGRRWLFFCADILLRRFGRDTPTVDTHEATSGNDNYPPVGALVQVAHPTHCISRIHRPVYRRTRPFPYLLPDSLQSVACVSNLLPQVSVNTGPAALTIGIGC